MALLSLWNQHPEPTGSRWATPTSSEIQQNPGHPPDPEAAARKLVAIARDLTCAQGWAYTGVTNTAFLRAGGSVAEYGAGIAHGIAHGLFAVDTSGTRITVLETIESSAP
jgi:hypothetical protein